MVICKTFRVLRCWYRENFNFQLQFEILDLGSSEKNVLYGTFSNGRNQLAQLTTLNRYLMIDCRQPFVTKYDVLGSTVIHF